MTTEEEQYIRFLEKEIKRNEKIHCPFAVVRRQRELDSFINYINSKQS